MRGSHFALPVRSGNALPKHLAHKSRHRFYGGIFWAVYLRSGGGAFAYLAAGICARSICEIQNHLCKLGAAGAEEPAKGIASTVRCARFGGTEGVRSAGGGQQSTDETQTSSGTEQTFIEAGARSVRREITRDYRGWRVYRA